MGTVPRATARWVAGGDPVSLEVFTAACGCVFKLKAHIGGRGDGGDLHAVWVGSRCDGRHADPDPVVVESRPPAPGRAASRTAITPDVVPYFNQQCPKCGLSVMPRVPHFCPGRFLR